MSGIVDKLVGLYNVGSRVDEVNRKLDALMRMSASGAGRKKLSSKLKKAVKRVMRVRRVKK